MSELSARLAALFPALENAARRFDAAFGHPVYIHLSRRDTVAQAVSLLKAEQTGLWHIHSDGSELERTAQHQDAEYDAFAIATLVDSLERDDRAWRKWFADHDIAPVTIGYEDLSHDPQSSLRTILSALDLDACLLPDIEPATARLADAHSESWVARFRAANPGR
jgi:LPS sulfotransferase NodH